MKKFVIGLAIGIVLGATGFYAVVREKLEKVATIENAQKVGSAVKNLGDTIVRVIDDGNE